MAEPYDCPWCGSEFKSEYDMQLHIEEQHTEDSPFATTDDAPQASASKASSVSNDDEDEAYLKCTRPGCGKRVPLDGIDEHLDMHEAAAINARSSSAKSQQELTAASIHQKAIQASRLSKSKATTSVKSSAAPRSRSILSFLAGRASQAPLKQQRDRGRLGTKELGQHAFEKSMPTSVRRSLEDAAKPVVENRINSSGKLVKHAYYLNETCGLIPMLADICALDDSVTTYLCHKEAKHIHRIKCDGNFCGYWNIQMVLNYILATSSPDRGLPTVLQIQDMIEKAWANNICAYGRIETGGILNTRKWIGTHEAVAFFRQLNLPVSTNSFRSDKSSNAHNALLDFVEAYFLEGLTPELEGYDNGSVITQLPPIYLQRAGHSMTIVGLTRRDNERCLLVFDPSHDTTQAMSRLLSGRSVRALPETILQPYRRSDSRLAGWDEYETLMYAFLTALRAELTSHSIDNPATAS